MKRLNRLKIGFVAAVATFVAPSCNYLDFDQSTGFKSESEVFETWARTEQSLTHLYGYLQSDFSSIGNAMRDCATDDAHYVWTTSNIHIFNDDRWSSMNTVDAQWSLLFSGIRDANSFLRSFAAADFDRFEYVTGNDQWLEKSESWSAQARFIRAYCHFELARRYGAIPLVADNIYTVDNVNDLTRAPFKEVAEYVAAECGALAAELPLDYADVSGAETGRITRGAALALRAKALLFLASKTYNSDATTKDWENAAAAAYDVIALNKYTLHSELFPFSNGLDVITSPELILERRASESSSFEVRNTSVSFEGGDTGTCPTQNLVDAFETKNGYTVTLTENGFESGDTAFDENYPYKNRDARFYATILYDGAEWSGKKMECYTGGKDALPIVGASETGYYLKKHMNPNVTLSPIVKPAVHTWVIFRYADILLMYAEAMNEAYGANNSNGNVDGSGVSLTALKALNMVRTRAGQPAKTETDTELVRKFIRNERRVELAFEDQRFWDIRRWGIGEDTNNINGVKITSYSANVKEYELKGVETRKWADKKYLYPIPINEEYNTSLGQNIGW